MGLKAGERIAHYDVIAPIGAGGMGDYAVWAPDGERILYRSFTGSANATSWAPVDGSQPPQELYRSAEQIWPRSVSPDGETLAFDVRSSSTGRDIWMLSLRGEPRPTPFIATEHHEGAARFGRGAS